MDKYEYNIKSDQIKKLYSRKEFEAAATIADEIDWYRVKDNTMISRVADIYENTKQYEKAKEVLLIAYERSPLGRQLAYKLTILALRTKNFVEADEFYQDFVEMSPSDVSQYLLKYRIAKAKGEDIEVLIKILESYIEVEMDERWQYELARLYHEAGQDDKCVAICDELELWFNDGKYVDKARELRRLITGMLTEYNKIYANDNMSNENKDLNVSPESEVNDSSERLDDEDKIGMKSLAEAIVASKEARKQKEANSNEEDSLDGLELLDDSMSEEEFLDDEINPDEQAKLMAAEAAKEVARRAEEAEKMIPVETEEERITNEAIKAAEAAAIEAQKAADFAKQLVYEAKLRAEQAKNAANLGAAGLGMAGLSSVSGNDRFKGMSAGEISKALEDEELLKGNSNVDKKDSMIEIFEFDKNKDGKCGNIGEELTKTAEIDIDEIKFKLADAENLYNTANIQAALAMSMEKLLDDEKKKVRNAFEMQIDDESNEIKPIDDSEDDSYLDDNTSSLDTKAVDYESKLDATNSIGVVEIPELSKENVEEPEEEIISEEVAPEETTISEEDVPEEEIISEEDVPEEETTISEEVVPEEETVSEETTTEENILEEPSSLVKKEEDEDFYLDDDENANEPTKRIDRDEINRILNASKNIYQTVPLSPLFDQNDDGQIEIAKPVEEDEQIEGQMTIDEVLEEYERIEESKKAENLANLETEDDVEEVESEGELEDEEENESEEVAKRDTGFVITNHKIPEDYKGLFSDFVGTGSMEESIADTLDNLINGFEMDGTSRANNVIVTGSAKIGKTTLGLSIIKAANRGRDRSGRKVAKVKASALNKRGVAPAMTQILGTDLIIEQAGNLMPNTIVDLTIAMKNYTEEMLIVLEDDKAAIDRMLDNSPDLKKFFTNRLDIHEMEINDMVKIAKEYAQEQFYDIDEMGELALYAKVDDISGRNPIMSIEDIQEIIDDAIAHANRFRIGKIFGRKNKGDKGTLSEHDFL